MSYFPPALSPAPVTAPVAFGAVVNTFSWDRMKMKLTPADPLPDNGPLGRRESFGADGSSCTCLMP